MERDGRAVFHLRPRVVRLPLPRRVALHMSEAGSKFSAEGLELNLSPDPAGVVIRVAMTGALAGLSRRITLPVELAAELYRDLGRAILRTRDMQDRPADGGCP